MAKENKLRKLEKKKFELIRNIKLCNDYKKEVIINWNKLKESFNQGFINYEEYYRRLSKSKYNEWLKYYDDSIKYNKNKLIEFNKEINREERRAQVIPFITTLIILSLIGLTVVVIRPEITGFTIGGGENITEENITIPENITATSDIAFKDCSLYKETDNGLYFCVDNEEVYECSKVIDLDEVKRCLSPKNVRKGITKDDCPFDYEGCNVMVNINEGWGGKQTVEDEKYKLAVFNKKHHCGNGHCVIPFYFKSNVSLAGDLLFNISTVDTLIENISIVNKNGENVDSGEGISMNQYDSGYYNAIFDYVPVWSSPTGIRTRLPMKFNITAFLDGKNILDLDPVAVASFGSNPQTDCDVTNGVDPFFTLSCSAGDIVVVGVSYEDSGTTTSIIWGAETFSKLGNPTAATLTVELWNTTCSQAESAKTLTVLGNTTGSNDDCAAAAVVYSGASYLRLPIENTSIVISSGTTSVVVGDSSPATDVAMLAGEVAVDVWGSDVSLVGANGQNIAVVSLDAGAAVGGISDCSYAEGGSDGSCNMSWAGTAVQGIITSVLVPVANTAPLDPTFLLTNSSDANQFNYTNETIDLNFVYSDPQADAGIGYITVYNNSVPMFELDILSMTSGSNQVVKVNSNNFTGADIGSNITWTVNVSDGSLGNTGANIWVNHDYIFRNSEPDFAPIDDFALNEDFGTFNMGALQANVTDLETADANIVYDFTNSSGILDISINNATGVVTLTSFGNISGTSTINITAWDANNAQDSDDFIVTVNTVNDPPWFDLITNSSLLIPEDTASQNAPINLSIYWNDVESGTWTTISVTDNSTDVSCSDSGEAIQCSPINNYTGPFIVNIDADDGTNHAYLSYEVLVNAVNDAPWIDGELKINSTDYSNKSSQDLWCFFTPTDVEADTETANVEWLKNNISQFTFTSQSVTKDVESSFILESENLTAGDLWNCQVRIYDQTAYSDWINSSQLEVLTANQNPSDPTGVLLNSTLATQTNLTNENLAANFLCDDPDTSDILTYDIYWYKEGIYNQSMLSLSCSDPQYVSYIFDETNTSKGENWSFSVNVTDNGILSSSTIFSDNLTIENSNPEINYVSLDNTIYPFDGGIKQFEFSFVANDNDTTGDLDDNKAIANVSLNTENYLNNSCVAIGNVASGRNYSCTIEMQYYYASGSWNYATEIKDDSGIAIQNSTGDNSEVQTWTYSVATFFNLTSPASLAWAQLIPAQTNQTSTTTMIAENTGNQNTLKIKTTIIDLGGASGKYIPAGNFSVFNATGAATPQCESTNQTGAITYGAQPAVGVNNSAIDILLNSLARGQGSQESLYYCLFDVPSYLQSETYDTTYGGSWDITAST